MRDHHAIVPGSYDPVTRGHVDVIGRAARLFDRLTVAVVGNPEKSACFSPERRVELIRAELEEVPNVDVLAYQGLTVRLASQLGARWIVRGIRSPDDAVSELFMAHSNRRCGPEEIETLFLPTGPELSFVSSRLVRQIAAEGGRLEAFVTPGIEKALREVFPDAAMD